MNITLWSWNSLILNKLGDSLIDVSLQWLWGEQGPTMPLSKLDSGQSSPSHKAKSSTTEKHSTQSSVFTGESRDQGCVFYI